MVILRGLPSSGKSTIAEEIKAKHKDSCFICATDDYWVRPDGTYDFNMELLGKSHMWNQNRVLAIARKEFKNKFDTIIVVDNTNITFSELRPYATRAKMYRIPVVIMESDMSWAMDVEQCYIRSQETHKVPYATILRMYNAWEPHDSVVEKLKKMDCKVLENIYET